MGGGARVTRDEEGLAERLEMTKARPADVEGDAVAPRRGAGVSVEIRHVCTIFGIDAALCSKPLFMGVVGSNYSRCGP